jgi:hypothetical protein
MSSVPIAETSSILQTLDVGWCDLAHIHHIQAAIFAAERDLRANDIRATFGFEIDARSLLVLLYPFGHAPWSLLEAQTLTVISVWMRTLLLLFTLAGNTCSWK